MSGGSYVESFCVLRDLLIDDRFCLIGLYDSQFPLYEFFKFLVRMQMKNRFPKIEQFLINIGISEDIYLTTWLLSIFTGFLPKFHCARI